jgi:mono/diheme cytochrome c family protein
MIGAVAIGSVTRARRLLAVAAALVCAGPTTLGGAGQAGSAATSASPRAVVDTYCVTCHSDRLRTAGLSLQSLDIANVSEHAEVWEKVVTKLRAAAMPPARAPRPDESTIKALARSLEGALDAAAASHPNPGRPALHRLNRAEYTNAIRDLLSVEIDPRTLLPADDQGFGFDNNADALTMSPGLMDRYLSAARKISRLALGDMSTPHVVETYSVPRLLTQDDRVSEALPFGSRGGIAIRHHFPLDAEYAISIRLQGRGAREQLDIRVDGERVAVSPAVPEATPGAAAEGTPDPVVKARFAAKAGTRVVGVALLQKTAAAEGLAPSRLPVGSISFRSGGVASVEIDGPFNAQGPGDTASRRKVFVCRPTGASDEHRCAAEILSTLARRAFRRAVTDKDTRTLLQFYDEAKGEGFEHGIRAALERVLVDPEFLFRVEREPAGVEPGGAYQISDVELASRLSFFLWSSIPDDELLAAATRGKLADQRVLEQQVARMLADPRSEALVTNFAAQWLYLRNMRAVAPDASRFPDFDDNLREAFQRETELFLASQLRENHPVADLLTANYTFVNERLARHYGIPNVYGSHFRRVTVDNPQRMGLLGQGSILTVTSYATRTSPVLRGKWLLENILGAPPPPPPPNVPALPENDEGTASLSIRERMEQHRKNPVCASCHVRMDPLGFALENFDAIGKWRDTDEDGTPIDVSGSLPDGTTFQGAVALRNLLLARRDEFVGTATEKLLTFALGRGVAYYDRPALRKIVLDAAPGGYRWSSIILGIVNSTPFEMRRARS